MGIAGASRSYNKESINFWMTSLRDNWENYFSQEELHLGRHFYKENVVKLIDLKLGFATINGKINKESFYSIVEIKANLLDVRISVAQTLKGKALAVAGLYEIEELLAETCDWLEFREEIKETPVNVTVQARKVETSPSREIILKFSTIPEGLFFQAYWEAINGERKEISQLNENQKLQEKEREKIIRLIHFSKENGFIFSRGGGILNEIAKIPFFIEHKLAILRKYFKVECAESVDLLRGKVKEIEVEVIVKQRDDFVVDMGYDLKVGKETLQSEEKNLLMHKRDGYVILPRMGIVTFSRENRKVIEDIGLPFTLSQQPKYMIFSLFEKRSIRLQLSPEVESWKQSMLKLPIAEEIDARLRPYQKQGVAWMQHLLSNGCGVLLADEMGLGKTLQILALLSNVNERLPRLIVCPASVIPVWNQEIVRFYPKMNCRILNSESIQHIDNEKITWLCSYTQLRQHKDILLKKQFSYAVLDEAQFIKNPDTKVAHTCIALKANKRIALTGTPLENRYMDVWTIFRFLMPGLLGSRQNFEERSKEPNFLESLHRQISPFVLRRTKNDVLPDLPEKTEINLICPLTDLQRQEYQKIGRMAIEQYGENLKTVAQAMPIKLFAVLTRLRQVCCDPNLLPWVQADALQSGKLNMLFDKLQECFANGKKVVIFSQFVTLLNNVRKRFESVFDNIPLYQLIGSTLDRKKPVEDFQSTKGVAAIIVSLKAGGTGITLHSADTVFLLDPWWNPAVENQAIDRIHRIGQDKHVFIYRLLTAGTIESKIQQLKLDKQDLFSKTVGNIKNAAIPLNYFHSLSDLIRLK